MSPRRVARARALCLATALAALPGCTWFDEHLPNFPGTPYTPDQPVAEVTVVGKINIDPVGVSTTDCGAGGTVFWGTARNSGDTAVSDAVLAIDALDGGGGVLGTWEATVFNGEVDDADPKNPIYGTLLEPEDTGSFNVCAPVPYGSVAGTAYRATFVVIEESE